MEWLKKADKAARHFQKQEAYAIYYNMVSDYYDILLDGSYDTEDPDEELLLNKMLDAIEKTLHYSKRGLSHDGNHLYAKNILAKATILMRIKFLPYIMITVQKSILPKLKQR